MFVIVMTNVFGIDRGSLALGLFLQFENVAFVFCREPKLLSCVKIAFMANRVFSKTCPEAFLQVL